MNSRDMYCFIRRQWRIHRAAGNVTGYMDAVHAARKLTCDWNAGLDSYPAHYLDMGARLKRGRIYSWHVNLSCTRWLRAHR